VYAVQKETAYADLHLSNNNLTTPPLQPAASFCRKTKGDNFKISPYLDSLEEREREGERERERERKQQLAKLL
jgi:hypothetical protein